MYGCKTFLMTQRLQCSATLIARTPCGGMEGSASLECLPEITLLAWHHSAHLQKVWLMSSQFICQPRALQACQKTGLNRIIPKRQHLTCSLSRAVTHVKDSRCTRSRKTNQAMSTSSVSSFCRMQLKATLSMSCFITCRVTSISNCLTRLAPSSAEATAFRIMRQYRLLDCRRASIFSRYSAKQGQRATRVSPMHTPFAGTRRSRPRLSHRMLMSQIIRGRTHMISASSRAPSNCPISPFTTPTIGTGIGLKSRQPVSLATLLRCCSPTRQPISMRGSTTARAGGSPLPPLLMTMKSLP